MSNNPPIKKFRLENVFLNVWQVQRDVKLADGSTVSRNSLNYEVGRSYFDKKADKWKDSSNLSFMQLLALRQVVDSAIQWHQLNLDRTSQEAGIAATIEEEEEPMIDA